MLQTSAEDKEALKEIVNTKGYKMPQIKISVYKNRRGRYKDILLWCDADRGTCRIEPIFVTDYQYTLQDIPNYQISINPNLLASAF